MCLYHPSLVDLTTVDRLIKGWNAISLKYGGSTESNFYEAMKLYANHVVYHENSDDSEKSGWPTDQPAYLEWDHNPYV